MGVTAFGAAEGLWSARLGTLRNVVRQEVIGRQLAGHVGPGMTVLDVGCGQGTQALRLAARGGAVTGVDPSARLLALLRADAARAGAEVEIVQAGLADLDRALPGRRFDLVCAHGLVMYLADRRSALRALTGLVTEGGTLSLTWRNAAALAFRPGVRRDWRAALDAFDRADYVNELGVHARADTLEAVTVDLEQCGFEIVDWYGVRVFTDPAAAEEPPPADADELAALLDAEDRAGRTDPYRQFGSQLHMIAREGSGNRRPQASRADVPRAP